MTLPSRDSQRLPTVGGKPRLDAHTTFASAALGPHMLRGEPTSPSAVHNHNICATTQGAANPPRPPRGTHRPLGCDGGRSRHHCHGGVCRCESFAHTRPSPPFRCRAELVHQISTRTLRGLGYHGLARPLVCGTFCPKPCD